MRPSTVRAAILALCLIAFACGCARETVEFSEWTVPVAEGTPVIEYAYVPAIERSEWIGLDLDLTMGGGSDAGSDFLYLPQAIAVDESGAVYVADAGDHEVKVFDDRGRYVSSFGREGQGPAEFMGPLGVAVAGTSALVVDANKLSLWDLAGAHRTDVAVQQLTPSYLIGLADGSVLVSYPAIDQAAMRGLAKFERWSSAAEPLAAFPTLPIPPPRYFPSATSEDRTQFSAGTSWPRAAADPSGAIYLTQSDEYQILAFDADGAPRWALRVAMPRPPLFRRDIERELENIRRRFPEASESAVDWPATAYALDTIWVDGHGHLYVLPYVPPELEAHERDVDVYSRDGERLFAGRMLLPAGAWTHVFAANGDHLFFLDQSQASGEWQVSRYQLDEPFARQ